MRAEGFTPDIEKYEKGGEVAVLISHGFGAGWSTWIRSDRREQAVYDVDLVKNLLGETTETMDDILNRKYPGEYTGGAENLTIAWVRKGTVFDILEYDGDETLQTVDSLPYKA